MVSLFGLSLGKPKCPVCGMLLTDKSYEWEEKRFCSQECKKSFRHGRSKGSGSCH